MKIFGQHDEQTLIQLEKVRERAVDAALMADGHVGYVMPIGGVAAYRDEVSVVGVGFDIACIAAGTPVLTGDGHHLPIERVTADDRALCWDGARVRAIAPLLGAAPRGVRRTVRVTLANGRSLVATPDHRIRTPGGWREAGALTQEDRVACVPFVGLPYERPVIALDVPVRSPAEGADLAVRGLARIAPDDRRLAPLVRLLGYISGDGHLARDGKSVSLYTAHEPDAAAVVADVALLGFAASTYRRDRGDGRQVEICVRVHSGAFHALLAGLGTPVGKKVWPREPMPWLFDMPAWVRAQFLSGLASAEMTTPRRQANGRIPNLQLRQSGDDDAAIRFVARLCASLGFEASVALSERPVRGRPSWVMQLLGGERAQVAFMEQVGFCFSATKRRAAASVASVAWRHAAMLGVRATARDEARVMFDDGAPWRVVVDHIASRNGVSRGFVHHAIYDDRGAPRPPGGTRLEPDADGEVAWVPVSAVEPVGELDVFDVVTADVAESFVANGIVVHNCGNAAIRTDLTLSSLGDSPEKVRRSLGLIADGVAASVSFGVGRRNRADDAPVDDPLFEDPSWDAVPAKFRQALKVKARQQLGTVGSGNHYVDVFADESGVLWVGVHFGSRGFGHTIASAFLAVGQGKAWGERAPEQEVLLPLAQPIGHDYWHLMNLAGRYAYAGREWVARKVVELMGGNEMELVHNHHNFAWRETHGGEEVIVIRKGATPAFPGQKGFIGGSMGDDAVIVRGTPAPKGSAMAATQAAALYSTVHGAGRVMSRTAAAGKRNRKSGKVITPGRVTPEMMDAWVREKGVILRGGGLDESPHVYRRLPDVLAAQEGTVEVLHTLRPLVVVMAGADEFDPYKD